MARSTVNLPVEIAEEVRLESERLDRSIQWLLVKAWREAKPVIRRLAPPPKDGAPVLITVTPPEEPVSQGRKRGRPQKSKSPPVCVAPQPAVCSCWSFTRCAACLGPDEFCQGHARCKHEVGDVNSTETDGTVPGSRSKGAPCDAWRSGSAEPPRRPSSGAL